MDDFDIRNQEPPLTKPIPIKPEEEDELNGDSEKIYESIKQTIRSLIEN